MKRLIDNTTPGGMGLVWRGLVPSFHKRSKIRDQRIREVISISDSLGENYVNRHLYLLKVSEMLRSVDSYNAYSLG